MLWPLLFGCIAGAAIAGAMWTSGMLNERSGMAVLVGAVALFYPVFAVQAEAGIGVILLHVLVFALFIAAGLFGFRRGSQVLALALIAHGVFDIFAHVLGAPGPAWWPAMCGGLDITLGGAVLYLIQKGRVPV